MIPIRNKKRKAIDLVKRVYDRAHLFRAWQYVEKRTASSRDETTQKALAAFRKDAQKEIAVISKSIRNGLFIFQPQRGYPKPRKGKTPRPIVIAPIVNRIVQRAILDICQSERSSVRRALGKLPEIIECETSVGGLPGRGVADGIDKIKNAIGNGAKWYVRSDLVSFFTAISKSRVERFLQENIIDLDFVDLFMRALLTELSNRDELREDLELFPLGDIGVPQGSALSALCANIILCNFDKVLNGRNVTTIRYLDDFVILAPTKKASERAWQQALVQLNAVRLSSHDPTKQTGKASMGEIRLGFEFLSFHIDAAAVFPSKHSQEVFLNGICELIRNTKREISRAGAEPRRAEPMFLQALVLIDKKIRGWGDAFSATSHRLTFSQNDEKIDRLIDEFMAWFGRQTKSLDKRARRRKMGIALLADTEKK